MEEPRDEELLRVLAEFGGGLSGAEDRLRRKKDPDLSRAQRDGFLRVCEGTSPLTLMGWEQWCREQGVPDLRVRYREQLLKMGEPDEWDVTLDLRDPTTEAVVALVRTAVERYESYRRRRRRNRTRLTWIGQDRIRVDAFVNRGAAEGLAHEILVLLQMRSSTENGQAGAG